jgi:endogenous inhibitor of DNA gyrase (YacG/DUF329 family)
MILKCPRCGKESDSQNNPFRPFCSERCKLVDLGSWMTGSYRIKGTNDLDDNNRTPSEQKDSEKK